MPLINLTTHDVVIFQNGKVVRNIQSSGVARLRSLRTDAGLVEGIPLVKVVYGPPTDLPEEEEGNLIIVPLIIKLLSKKKRGDLITPTQMVYDSFGRKIGCNAFAI